MNVKTTLVLSLKQDISVLSKLIENIPKSYKDHELNSWLFPSKPYDFVTKIVDSEQFKKSNYQNDLEIALDRLYVIIRLIILYIDNNCNLKRGSKINELIFPPSRLTIGYCVNLLWTRILKSMEKGAVIRTSEIGDYLESCDKEAQTDIISLNKCDSCSSAMLCMKNLLNFFEKTKDSNERLTIKYKIFDITQFGCMLKVTSSIEDRLNSLFKQLHEKKMENDVLKLESEECKTELQAKERKIELFEEEILILRGKLGHDNKEMLVLRQEAINIKKENNLMQSEIKKFHMVEEKLTASLRSMKEQNGILKEHNDDLTKNINTSIQLLSQYIPKLNRKIDVLETEYNIIKCIIDQYEETVNCLNIKLLKVSKSLEKVDLKIKFRYGFLGEVVRDFQKYDGFCGKIKELFTEKLQHIEETNKTLPKMIQLKGNPIEDFPKQIEENKSKIKSLENENIKLQELLSRFKNIKTG